MIRSLLLPLCLLAGCAASPAQIARQGADDLRTAEKLDRELAGYTAGTPVSCMPLRGQNSRIFGESILYEGGGRQKYLARTTGGCFGLRRDDIIVTRTNGGQLCRGDIIRTIERTSQTPSGACSVDEFIPYTRNRRR